MDKINFENLPSTNTPINAENLNKVQDNIEKAIPAVIDNLESDSATDALSPKQGKVLNKKIEQRITTDEEYATNEYIDGKQVYRKRVDIGILPNATTKNVEHGLTNFKLIRFYGIATTTGSNYSITLPCLHLDGLTYSVSLFVSNTNIEIRAGSNRSGYTGYVDLYYTKN